MNRFETFGSSRYRRKGPAVVTETIPTFFNTLKCLETAGWGSARPCTNSPTGFGLPPAKRLIISRRRGSAIALNTSLVVAALATLGSYSHISICATGKIAGEVGFAGIPGDYLGIPRSGGTTTVVLLLIFRLRKLLPIAVAATKPIKFPS